MNDKLKAFGLNGSEARVYSALMQEGVATAHILAKKAQVPFGKIYTLLESLDSKGFLHIHQGAPKMYRAIAPEIILHSHIQKEKEKLQELEKTAKEVIASALSPKTKKKPEETVEVYYGHAAAFARSITLHQQAKTYWKTISALTVNKKHLEACSAAIKKRVVMQALTSLDLTNKERIQEWVKKGIQVRILKDLPFRISIYDDLGVVLRFSHETTKQYIGIHIINQKLAKGMHALFQQLWEQAKEV